MYTKYNIKVRALSVNAVFRRLILATHCIVWGNNTSLRVTTLNYTVLGPSLMQCSALGSVSSGITLTHGSVNTNDKVPTYVLNHSVMNTVTQQVLNFIYKIQLQGKVNCILCCNILYQNTKNWTCKINNTYWLITTQT